MAEGIDTAMRMTGKGLGLAPVVCIALRQVNQRRPVRVKEDAQAVRRAWVGWSRGWYDAEPVDLKALQAHAF